MKREALKLMTLTLYDNPRVRQPHIEVLHSTVVPQEEFAVLKRKAADLMAYRGCEPEEMTHLESTPYRMWLNRYVSGEMIHYLGATVDMKAYTDMERELDSAASLQKNTFPDICGAFETLGYRISYMVVFLEENTKIQLVATPKLPITSEIVESALRDAETLIQSNGAPNALDRVHTAFHGYLREICPSLWEGLPLGFVAHPLEPERDQNVTDVLDAPESSS
jgi:hypothetical protein